MPVLFAVRIPMPLAEWICFIVFGMYIIGWVGDKFGKGKGK